MDTDTQTTLAEFLEKHTVEIASTKVPSNPHMDERADESYHWHVTLEYDGRSMLLYYSMGSANHGKRPCHIAQFRYNQYKKHYGPIASKWIVKNIPGKRPETADVLNCLASDADVFQHDTFEDWASDFGYDSDSRTAEKTYRACIENAIKLRNLFGPVIFNELLACERL